MYVWEKEVYGVSFSFSQFYCKPKITFKKKRKEAILETTQFWKLYMVLKTVLDTDYRTLFSAYCLSDTVLSTFIYVNSINPHNNLEREVLLSSHFVHGKTEAERVSTLPRYT